MYCIPCLHTTARLSIFYRKKTRNFNKRRVYSNTLLLVRVTSCSRRAAAAAAAAAAEVCLTDIHMVAHVEPLPRPTNAAAAAAAAAVLLLYR